jgi:plasmid stabilization system protein ParE
VVQRIVWTRKALADLREIHDYIARDSPRYGQIQVERIQNAAEKIGRFPEIGRIVPEFPDGPWREVLTGNYRIIYRWDSESGRGLILAVVHGRQLLRPEMIGPG